MDLQNALASLDPGNDGHWTSEDLPRIDVLQEMTGNKEINRKGVTEFAPDFTRLSHAKALDAAAKGQDPNAKPEEAEPDTTPGVEPTEGEIEGEEGDDEERDEEAMSAPFAKVMSDRDLCERVMAQLEKDEAELVLYIEESQKELAQIRAKQDRVSRRIQQFERDNPKPKENPFKAYQKTQMALRMKRAEAMKRVPQPIGSPLDRAMGSRRTAQVPGHIADRS